jgi:hypothetical protein
MSDLKKETSSSKNGKSERKRGDSKRKETPKHNTLVEEQSDEEDVIDLCDDHDYQVLSAVFETDGGRNVAEILSRLQKDVHLLAMSVHQLIQLSLASQRVRKNDENDESDFEGSYEDGDNDGGEENEENAEVDE